MKEKQFLLADISSRDVIIIIIIIIIITIIIIIIIIIIILGISFMQGIYTYISEKNHVPRDTLCCNYSDVTIDGAYIASS